MPNNIFVAVENPRSMLGYHKEKSNNYPLIDRKDKHRFPFEDPLPTDRGGKERAEAARKEKYETRKAYIQDKGSDPFTVDALRAKDRELADAFCKAKTNARLAQSGSLASLIKRMIWYVQNDDCRFHTVMFLGHGNDETMAVGTGRATLSEAGRKVFDADKREISVANTSVWMTYFTEAAKLGCFCPDPTDDRLHVFLLGCLTAANEKASIVDIVAVHLRQDLDRPVAVYGPTSPIAADETGYVLDNLDDIKRDGPSHTDVWIGELPRGADEEDDPLGLGAVFLHCKVID